ncbi:hypothetical protein ACQEVB_17820 [Pseudonocardia sp. CA-107938]|uniref:hypothetical protein n=1 Tax=Pseudonocardia sp. CA-107938 TaxID=3240021 RepID=UPI003D89DA8C
MDALRALIDDPRAPLAFLLLIVLITVASLVAHRVRRPRVGTGARRPWPAVAAAGTTVLPIAPAPALLRTVPQRPEPIGTVLLVVTPGGPVAARRPAELLGLEPGLHVRVRRADLDPHALVAALPDEAASLLDDLTAAPTDATRNARFRRAADAARPKLPCATILAGPPGTAPVVATGVIDMTPLLGAEPRLAALLARAVATGARTWDRRDFATALLAAARACPAGALISLDDLDTDDPWVAAHRAELGRRYGSLLGVRAEAS